MKTCGDSTLHTCSSYSDPFKISPNTNSMITIHGNNNNNNSAMPGIPIPPSYSSIETDDLLDDYSTSTFSSHAISAPPPSPQDASPLDGLFAQHLTSKLQQTIMIATSSASPHSKYSSTHSTVTASNEMDMSSPSSLLNGTKPSSSWKLGHPSSSVLMPGSLPLTYTTTYHHQPTKMATKHHGVDPHQLDYLLRRVSRNHPRHSHGQPRSYRPSTKRIGAFHKRPSRIPLYTKRLGKHCDKDKQMDCDSDGMNSKTSWKQNASRQKAMAITTAVEKWKQLKQYEQDDKNRTKSHEEVDRIVHDLKEMGL